jgi:hypothetical protein
LFVDIIFTKGVVVAYILERGPWPVGRVRSHMNNLIPAGAHEGKD